MPGRDVKKEQDKWEKSGAQCGGGRAWVDRKSNRMRLNERESVEKSAANEWQGYQGSAEHSTSSNCTGSLAMAESENEDQTGRKKTLNSCALSSDQSLSEQMLFPCDISHYIKLDLSPLGLAVWDQLFTVTWPSGSNTHTHTIKRLTPYEMSCIMPLFYCVEEKRINGLVGISQSSFIELCPINIAE